MNKESEKDGEHEHENEKKKEKDVYEWEVIKTTSGKDVSEEMKIFKSDLSPKFGDYLIEEYDSKNSVIT